MDTVALPPILDVRGEPSFVAGHAPGAVNIPVAELTRRAHELPPRGDLIRLFDDHADRPQIVTWMLRERGYAVEEVRLGAADLRETGPSRARLWQPSPFLVEALARIRSVAGAVPLGRALDVACGSGRDAVYLALAGYEVDAIDVLPDALARARDLARRSGVSLATIEQDLKRRPELPAARYALVSVVRFLHRPILGAIRASVAPGGFVVYEAFHRRDAEEGRRRLKAGHALDDGELAAAFVGFDPLIARDGVKRDDRVFSQLLARHVSR